MCRDGDCHFCPLVIVTMSLRISASVNLNSGLPDKTTNCMNSVLHMFLPVCHDFSLCSVFGGIILILLE